MLSYDSFTLRDAEQYLKVGQESPPLLFEGGHLVVTREDDQRWLVEEVAYGEHVIHDPPSRARYVCDSPESLFKVLVRLGPWREA